MVVKRGEKKRCKRANDLNENQTLEYLKSLFKLISWLERIRV